MKGSTLPTKTATSKSIESSFLLHGTARVYVCTSHFSLKHATNTDDPIQRKIERQTARGVGAALRKLRDSRRRATCSASSLRSCSFRSPSRLAVRESQEKTRTEFENDDSDQISNGAPAHFLQTFSKFAQRSERREPAESPRFRTGVRMIPG